MDAAAVVNAYDLPEDEQFKKKVERMSDLTRPAFESQRTKLRRRLIAAEEERQRLRVNAHSLLT